MIISCPSCATRYDIPSHQMAADGSLVRCASCGHSWIEGRAIEVVSPHPSRQLATVIDHAPDTEGEIRRLVEARRDAEAGFAARRALRRRRAWTWAGLAIAAALPLVLFVGFPGTVVRFLPGAAPAYAAIGEDVNIYGLELRRVEMQHIQVDGEVVLAVKGEIANVSGSERKIPWLRFGLRDPGGKEVYLWTLESGARPLRPGESTNFVTRVATPPETAATLEIRFARADEIGSNAAP